MYMIYHLRQLISLTLVRQESLLTFSVGFMGDSHKLYTYSTPIFTYMVMWSCLGKNTGNNTKQLTSPSQHPICRDDEIHASPFQPEASSVSAPPCKVGGHWRLQNGYLCKMYENFRIVIMMGFGGPSQLFHFDVVNCFGFPRVVGMCQHSQPNTLNANISLYFALQRKKS